LSIEILLDWILDLFTAVFGGIPGCIWSVRQRFIEGTASSNQVTSLQKKSNQVTTYFYANSTRNFHKVLAYFVCYLSCSINLVSKLQSFILSQIYP
jgi:hypothetical protein